MSLEDSTQELQAYLARHRTAAIAGVGALVAAIAVIARRKAKATADSAGVANGYTPAGYSAGGQGTYDSTANDVYNSLQPSIEDLQHRLDEIAAAQTPVKATPAPIPAPKKPAPKPAPRPAPKPTTPPITRPKTYSIKNGDSLGSIAARFHTTAGALYTKNAATLETAAKKHGQPSSRHGNLVYPGTVIRL